MTDENEEIILVERSRVGEHGSSDKSCFSVNVEPVVFLVACCVGLSTTSSTLFTYWARCVEIASDNKNNQSTNATYMCAMIPNFNSSLQVQVEKDIAGMKIWLQISGCLPTLITSSTIGSWSDHNGRKTPLIFTLFGFLLASLLYLMSTLTYEITNVYYWGFGYELVVAVFGGIHSTYSTALTIITDECRAELKGSTGVPFRIGLAVFIRSSGMLIGSSIASTILVPALTSIDKHVQGYSKIAIIVCALATSALIYAIFFVRETHFPKREHFNNVVDVGESERSELTANTLILLRVRNILEDVFSVFLVRRSGWTRMCLCMTVVLVFVEYTSFDPALLLLLVKRQPFAWNDNLFSYYSTTKIILSSIGTILWPPVLTCFNRIGKDSLLIIVSLAAEAGKSYSLAFATTTSAIFYTCLFSVIMGGLQPALRSFLPKMVAKEETARLLTVVNIIMSFSPILSSLIFNSIFKATLNWWPGFSFFVTAIFQTFVFFGQLALHFLMQPQWSEEGEQE